MSDTEVEAPEKSPMPELTEEDYNAPFLHETTSPTTVVLVLVALIITCGLIVYSAFISV